MTNRPLSKKLAIGLAPVLLLLASCSDPNPLLGSWEYDKEQSQGLAAAGAELSMGISGVDQIEFREDKMVSGSKSETVTYEVAEDRVIVTGADGEGVVYTIVDENTVILDSATGRIAYRRVQPSVATPGPESAP
ncbi:MAG: hypothetical protein QNK04_10855 [Myxococcota bacterium]|nr:hypothetical protein [Myxococcota bacterium]